MTRLARTAMAATLLAAPLPAAAHSPNYSNILVGLCWPETTEILICEGGYSVLRRSWKPIGTRLTVIAADGSLLHAAELDGRGRARFPRPAQDFRVLIGDRPGHAVEIAPADIDATPRRP